MSFLHALEKLVPVLDDAGFYHLTQEVVAFPRPLADSGKHGESVVFLGDIVNQLLDQHGLSYTGSTEQTDFSTFQIGFQQIDHLDTGKQHFLRSGKVFKFGRILVDRLCALNRQMMHTVDGFSHHVHHTSSDLLSHRHGNWFTGRIDFHPSLQAVGTVHGHRAHGILSDVLLHLNNKYTTVIAFDSQSIVNAWQVLSAVHL